jgi:hypothetical protein
MLASAGLQAEGYRTLSLQTAPFSSKITANDSEGLISFYEFISAILTLDFKLSTLYFRNGLVFVPYVHLSDGWQHGLNPFIRRELHGKMPPKALNRLLTTKSIY